MKRKIFIGFFFAFMAAAVSRPVLAAGGPAVKTIRGPIKSVNFEAKTFKLTPDNAGLPIEVVCDSAKKFQKESVSCSMEGLTTGINVEVRLAYEDEKWQARSVKIV